MSDQCYHSGDFWQCVTATSAGQSPTTTPASWRKITLPNKWRWVLAQLTYANLLRLDGQTDKANIAMSIGYGRERTGLDELVRQEANEEVHRGCHRGREARVNTGRTRPVKASVILDDAYRLIGWDADQLDDREKADARAALSQAVQEVWEAWWWQELMTCEQAAFAADLETPTGYTVGEYFYDHDTDSYYVALATWISGAGTEPEESLKLEAYDPAEPVPGDWDETSGYDKFDRVTYGGQQYQCIADDTPAGERPTDLVYWYLMQNWKPTLPYVDRSGVSYGPFGPIRSVAKFDPRTSANPQHFELDVTAAGTRVRKMTVTHPWVWARRVTPVITGDDFDATETYEATDPEDLVYDN
jgi:hypothetical protein